ncbi:MAG: prolyl oligopeptidase family serine peptidase [Phycisphaerales bacterium]|nr:prolyl oligopeptidase family serine peptidase [Phycisphaerales bacterium]
MHHRFRTFPQALRTQARAARLGHIPALLAHPDWSSPRPIMLWLHGRTASKELDPGRYLRWIRAGLAACAIDLPGHGERATPGSDAPDHTPATLQAAIAEIDTVVAALSAPEYAPVFDTTRLGIGGMSMGGMVALRRLCDPHLFRCASVEATTGFLGGLYFPARHGLPADRPWPVSHDAARINRLDPIAHLDSWRPIPLQALHSESDRIVPFLAQSRFIDALRAHYTAAGADPALIELKTWPHTGAPDEHIGFGPKSNDAKNAQVEFLTRQLAAS